MNLFVRTPAAEADPPQPGAHAQGWLDPWLELIANRCELIGIESRAAACAVARRLVLAALAAGLFFFGWALVLGGTIALISAGIGRPWYHCALAVALLHLVAAWLLVARLRRSRRNKPIFAHTRAEFRKDREWIETLQKKSGS